MIHKVHKHTIRSEKFPLTESVLNHESESFSSHESLESPHNIIAELLSLFSLITDKIFDNPVLPNNRQITEQCQQIMRAITDHIIM